MSHTCLTGYDLKNRKRSIHTQTTYFDTTSFLYYLLKCDCISATYFRKTHNSENSNRNTGINVKYDVCQLTGHRQHIPLFKILFLDGEVEQKTQILHVVA
jgi:hypothetical protein